MNPFNQPSRGNPFSRGNLFSRSQGQSTVPSSFPSFPPPLPTGSLPAIAASPPPFGMMEMHREPPPMGFQSPFIFAQPAQRASELFGRASSERLGMKSPSEKDSRRSFDFEQSPWAELPEHIKDLFNAEKVKLGQLELDQASLEETSEGKKLKHPHFAITKSNFDTCFLSNPQTRFYSCFNCSISVDERENPFFLCESCFDPLDHQGHIYEEISPRGLSRPVSDSCWCGKDGLDACEAGQAFRCKKHQPSSKNEVESKLDRKQFEEFFGSLFSLLFFAKLNYPGAYEFECEMLDNAVTSAVRTSPEACRILVEALAARRVRIIRKENTGIFGNRINEDNCSILYHLLKEKHDFVHYLLSDTLCLQILTKFIIAESSSNHSPFVRFALQHISCIRLMMQGGYYRELERKHITAFASHSAEHAAEVVKYLEWLEERENLRNWCREVLMMLGNIKVSDVLAQMGPYLLPKLLKGFALYVKGESEPGSEEENEGRSEEIPQTLFITFIGRLIYSVGRMSAETLRDCRQIFPSLMVFPNQLEFEKSFNVTQEKYERYFEEYLQWMLYNNEKIEGSFSNSLKLLLNICIIRSPRKDEFIRKLIHNILGGHQVQVQRRSLFDRSPRLLDFYDKFLALVRLCLLSRIYNSRYENNSFASQQQVEQLRDYRRKCFLSYLYEVKVFTPEKMQFTKAFFNIPDFNELVKEHLVYNVDLKTFFFAEKEKFPNRLMFLFNEPTQRNVQQEPIFAYFNLKCQEDFNRELENELQKDLIQEIIVNSEFIACAVGKIEAQLANSEGLEGNVGTKLVEFLVVLSLISQGKNEQVMKIIEKLKTDAEYRRIFERVGSKQEIETILCLAKPTSEEARVKSENAEEEAKQELKERMEARKKQKYEKLKEKQNKCMEAYSNQESGEEADSKEGDVCIICREKSRKENQLVYLAKAVSNSTLATCLYEQRNKMRTQFDSCFHGIHVDCYLKRVKKLAMASNDTCTLCSKPSNCILPERFYQEERKTLRICTNSIITAFFSKYETYDIESLFILMLKHLVESKSLNSLANLNRFEDGRRKREKINSYIERFLREMYQHSTPDELRIHDESVSCLLAELSAQPDDILCRLQEMMLGLCWQKIKTGSVAVDMQALKNLSEKMDQSEFRAIKMEMEDLGAGFTQQQELALLSDHGQENIKEKIGKNFPIQPPEFVHQISGFGSKICHFCKTTMRETICLICSFELCNHCEGSINHRAYHQDKMLTFSFGDASIQYEDSANPRQSGGLFGNSRNSDRIDLYYTELMIPFSQRNHSHRRETFRLNNQIFAKYCSKF